MSIRKYYGKNAKYVIMLCISLVGSCTAVSNERISDLHSLDSYLRSEEDREQWLLRGSPDLASSQVLILDVSLLPAVWSVVGCFHYSYVRFRYGFALVYNFDHQLS